jgi:Mannosyl-glycoprotein endo-beta-N-acetylglucosaminidase
MKAFSLWILFICLLTLAPNCIVASQGASSLAREAEFRSPQQLKWPPVPAEDRIRGRNDHAYDAARDATPAEQQAFIARFSSNIEQLQRETGIPASVMLAMACVESGYGMTRTAVFANNYFGIKWQNGPADETWQLIGQPQRRWQASGLRAGSD